MAIVAHALTISNSAAKETAFGRLHQARRETGTFFVLNN